MPGRHELNGTQEIRWDGVMRAIADSGFSRYVAHEFVLTGDPMVSCGRLQIFAMFRDPLKSAPEAVR